MDITTKRSGGSIKYVALYSRVSIMCGILILDLSELENTDTIDMGLVNACEVAVNVAGRIANLASKAAWISSRAYIP